MNLPKARILMICDDQQIDRRILHEGATLVRAGFEVIVIGRAGNGCPENEIIDGVKIDRIDHRHFIEKREADRQTVAKFAEINGPAPQKSGFFFSKASGTILLKSAFNDYGPYWLDRWIHRRGWLVRNFMKALLWPPYRLHALHQHVPFVPTAVRHAIYLPTLLLTPRPSAIRWHWLRIQKRLQPWQEERQLRRIMKQNEARLIKAKGYEKESLLAQLNHEKDTKLAARVSRIEDLNEWELAVLERSRLYRPDIVHVHDLPQLRPAVFAAEELGVPAIYDSHELYTEYNTIPPAKRRELKAIERHFIRKVDHVIGVNPFVNRVLAEDYGIAMPTSILNATVLPDGFSKGTRTDYLRKTIGLSPDDKIILFHGWAQLNERGLAELVPALAATPDHIHLALMVYGEELPRLKKIIKGAAMEQRVHLVPTVPQKELLWWVASADAGIIPSKPVHKGTYFCSPNKLFDFIAAGVPVLANDLPYLRQVIEGEGFGMVHELKEQRDFAEGINRFFADFDAKSGEYRRRILAAQDRYLWSGQEHALLAIYEELLQPAKMPSQAHAA